MGWFRIWWLRWHVLEGLSMWRNMICLGRVMWLCFGNVELKHGPCFLSCWRKCGKYNLKYIRTWLHFRLNVPKKWFRRGIEPRSFDPAHYAVERLANPHIKTTHPPPKQILLNKILRMWWRSGPPTPFSQWLLWIIVSILAQRVLKSLPPHPCQNMVEVERGGPKSLTQLSK